jgi:hypothetical protein
LVWPLPKRVEADLLAHFHLVPAARDKHPEIDRAELHHIAGDIDDAKTAQLSRVDVETASIWARGESDILRNTCSMVKLP